MEEKSNERRRLERALDQAEHDGDYRKHEELVRELAELDEKRSKGS